MPQTRLIRPCHPKNLSVNHLYPIELTRIWGATPFQPQRRPVSNSSNCGLSQLPTLYNNFNKIEGLYQESPPGSIIYVLNLDDTWRESNPRHRNISSTHRGGFTATLPTCSAGAIYILQNLRIQFFLHVV